jgi:multiple sugar transport system substrate-binding protein
MQSFVKSIALAGFLGLTSGFAQAADATINVLYANDRTTAEAHEEIKSRFEAENPGIRISFLVYWN